jgi:hypothetical protein
MAYYKSALTGKQGYFSVPCMGMQSLACRCRPPIR